MVDKGFLLVLSVGYLQLCQFCQVGKLILVFKVEAISLHVSEIRKIPYRYESSCTPNITSNEKNATSKVGFYEKDFSHTLTPKTAFIETVTHYLTTFYNKLS